MRTFLNLDPEYTRQETALFHVQPIPYEGTVCFESGTAEGPDAILAVSDQMEYIDETTHYPFFRHGVYTWDPIPAASTPTEEMARIEETVDRRELFRPDRFPVFLGGEHSITAPVVYAAKKVYPNLSVIQFDAHSDLRDEFPPGGKASHASVMRRVLEVVSHLVQVGIRSFSEEDLIACPNQVKHFITPDLLDTSAGDVFESILESMLGQLTDPVYLTIDMDVFDPSAAPGVGTPEPGGLTWRQVTRILERLFQTRKVIGADVVETMPLGGRNVVTEFMAARLVGKIMTGASLAWDREHLT